ncbi:hypothetical protein F5884DRAFT_796390 [Xylogone sp. PMI_703]|nr:hypothetical protein F5884DRAFT_796390 [Xylogone sp. PMI_703]
MCNSETQHCTKSRPLKLRASCDACFLAKVKCSKARPICSRCLAWGEDCNYSPSARAGKPKSDGSRINRISNPRNLPMLEDPAFFECPTYAMPTMNIDVNHPTPSTIKTESSILSDSLEEMMNGILAMPASAPITVDDIASRASYGANEDLPDSYVLGEDNPRDGTVSVTPSNGFLQSGTNILSEVSQPPLADHWVDQLENIISPGSICGLIPETTISMTDYHNSRPPVCHCFDLCLQALQALYDNFDTVLVPLSFDVTLPINQKAVDACSIMLNCQTCMSRSNPGIRTMLLGTIISKITSVHQESLKNLFELTSMPGNSIQSPPLLFDSYGAQGEHDRWLEAEIILREVEKLRMLFNDFREKLRTYANQEDSGIYNAVTDYIHYNLQSTVNIWEKYNNMV